MTRTWRRRSRPAGCPQRRGLRIGVLVALVGVFLSIASSALGMPQAGSAWLASVTDSPASPTAGEHAAETDESPPGNLRLTGIAPAVVGPADSVTISGIIAPTSGRRYLNPQVRVVEDHRAITLRQHVSDWADTRGPVRRGVELGRTTLTGSVQDGGELPFQITVPAAVLERRAAIEIIPIAIELTGLAATGPEAGATNEQESDDVIRTFLGWHRHVRYTPVDIAWLVPITLPPDPALSDPDLGVRDQAWLNRIGPNGSTTRLLKALEGLPVTVAVDPTIVNPPEQSASAVVAELATRAARPDGSMPVLALPTGDPDLAVLATTAATQTPAGQLVRDMFGAPDSLGPALNAPVGTGVAWPADGRLADRERGVRAAYGTSSPTVLVSAAAVSPGADPTPSAPARTAGGTRLLRWDDRLSAMLALADGRAGPGPPVLSTQRFIADSATVVMERPSRSRQILVAAPRETQIDPASLRTFLATVTALPWLHSVPVTELADLGGAAEVLPARPRKAPGPRIDAALEPSASPVTPELAADVTQQQQILAGLATVLDPDSPLLDRQRRTGIQVLSTRWRGAASEHRHMLADLSAGVRDLEHAVSVTPQRTNFLADEGVLQVTVVNNLDEPVHDIHVHLAPSNGRVRVIEEPAPISIGAKSKATVAVRMAALAPGLVSINAWIGGPNEVAVGQVTTLEIRAAPPGAWFYLAVGSILVLLLVVGVIRSVRRPGADLTGVTLDPVDPTPEPAPVTAPRSPDRTDPGSPTRS